LDYEKPASTGTHAKISTGSFWPFSTASVNRVVFGRGSASFHFCYPPKPDVTATPLRKLGPSGCMFARRAMIRMDDDELIFKVAALS
jgi:hypothetical protein